MTKSIRKKYPKRKTKGCVNCANWQENPEQCLNCSRNSEIKDMWRPVGSAGFVRDTPVPQKGEHLTLGEAMGLIDGVYDIVYMWKPEGKFNEGWKKKWLADARRFGASLD